MAQTLKTPTINKLKPPKKFEVLLLNDDYTTMEFVIEVLMSFFNKNQTDATRVMLQIHTQGQAVCGIYNFDIAQTKVGQVIDYARKNDQPLMCTLREMTH